jgi:hypothetical protein
MFSKDGYDRDQRVSSALANAAMRAVHGDSLYDHEQRLSAAHGGPSYRYTVPLLTRLKRQARPRFIASLLASIGAFLGHSATQAVQTHFESLNQLEQRLAHVERQLTALEHHANRREDNRP